jgi:hypothetical protein
MGTVGSIALSGHNTVFISDEYGKVNVKPVLSVKR